MRIPGKRFWIITILALLILAAQVWAIHRFLTLPYSGGNDFYSRWAGARALLVEGRDPYSLEVTAEIQAVKGLDPAMVGKGSFAYPLPVIFFFWPLVYVSYPLALAAWMVLLQWLLVATVVLLLRLFHWQLRPLALAALFIAALLMYPVSRSILLGQFTIHVVVALAGSLLLLRGRRDGWAGVLLAATSIKLQMMILIAPWLVIWAVVQRRWRFLYGLLAAGMAMFFAAMLLDPDWPVSFVVDIQRYAGVAGGKNPLVVLFDQISPSLGQPLRLLIMAALLLAAGLAGWRALRPGASEDDAHQALYWMILASLLTVFQTGTTNQVLLLIPLVDWMHRLSQRRAGPWLVAALNAALILAAWGLFLATIDGNAEAPVMFLLLPALALLAQLGIEISRWRARSRQPSA